MWFTICAQLFIWHVWSQPLRQQAFSLAAFFTSLLLLVLLSVFSLNPTPLPHFPSFSSFVPLHSHSLSLIRFLRLVLSSSFTFFVPSHSPLRASFICLLHYHSTFLISVQPHPPGASSALLLNTWKPSEAARLIPSLVSLPSVLLLFPFLILSASLLNMRKTIYFPSPLSHSNLHLFKFHRFASFPDLFVAIVPLLRII